MLTYTFAQGAISYQREPSVERLNIPSANSFSRRPSQSCSEDLLLLSTTTPELWQRTNPSTSEAVTFWHRLKHRFISPMFFTNIILYNVSDIMNYNVLVLIFILIADKIISGLKHLNEVIKANVVEQLFVLFRF